MQEYLPLILTAMMGSALATKLIKNGVEAAMAAVGGVFRKLPPGLTRTLAIMLGAIIAALNGNAVELDALVGAISGAVLTGAIALLGRIKPTRVPE